jgi:23S rRNA pseudoU1915 N3-methylase RlmH
LRATKITILVSIAGEIERAGIAGVQQFVMAIDAADGWSQEDRKAAQQIVSFGRISLPHELRWSLPPSRSIVRSPSSPATLYHSGY